MARNDDDIFKPKLGRIRSAGGKRSRNYVDTVLHRLSAFGNKGRGPVEANRRFTGTRIGRGNNVMRLRFAGGRFGPASRRVVIKSRIIKLAGTRDGMGIDAARAHIRYIQRDGVSKEHETGRLYDAATGDADGAALLERSEGDRHQFRFIVSPEDATELADLKPFVRDLMETMEGDLGTRLDWVAIDHFNTGHPHTHIVLRGKDDTGKDLIIARDYISHGMRQRGSELLTLELGEQTDGELRRKLEHQVGQHRFTDIDRMLIRDADDGRLDGRRALATSHGPEINVLRVGRLRVLEKLGLAREDNPGQWRLSPNLEDTLRRLGERSDIIKTMHRGLKAAGVDAGTADYSIYDPGDPRTRAITGRIIDRGLHDEMKDGHYVIVDAADGRVHYVALDPRLDMDDLPLGAIVEVQPTAAGLKPSDRTIAEVARRNGGIYSPELHHDHDGEASEDFIKAHVRRLEALRRQNIVRRFNDGSWEIPDDFQNRVAALAAKQSRYPQRVLTLSYLSLDRQVNADGATWLDRQLLAKEPTTLHGGRFGAEATEALHRREQHLIAQGLAERDGQKIRYQRNLLRLLRQRELAAAGEKLAKEIGLPFAATNDGDRIEGVYRRPLRLASGKFAVLESSKEFTLVPWRPVLERRRGQAVGGVMRGSSVSFEFEKKRGIGLG